MYSYDSQLYNVGKAYILLNFLLLYVNVFITFSCIYLFLDIVNLGSLVDPYLCRGEQYIFSDKLKSSFQLSAATLLYDGKMAIIPLGWSRIVAFIEGTFGFLLPPFIMMRYIPTEHDKFDRKRLPVTRLIRRAFFVSIGALFVSLGLKSFLVPNHIIDGGIVGISIIFSYLTGLKLELFLFLLNIPFLYLGYKKIGKRFVVTTVIGISILSLGMFFLYNVPVPTKNLFIASIFGGTLLGIGVGMVIRYGGSLDGTEILGILINRSTSFSVGRVVMFINIFIFCSAGFVFGWDKAMYSILTYVIASKMIDATIEGFHT